jgi:hypothetical protein
VAGGGKGSRNDGASLRRAFDEMRFGSAHTLNLRAQQPTALQATAQTEQWLRQLQVQGAAEALVITGRGNRSLDGYSPVREAIARLLPSLRRRNVISGFEEHTPGSFVVTFAPVRALLETPKRRREKKSAANSATHDLGQVDVETVRMLRELSQMSLALLGVHSPSHRMLDSEMKKQFSQLSAALPENGDKEALLQQAILRAIEELESN